MMILLLTAAAVQAVPVDDATLRRRYGVPSDIRAGGERVLTWSDLEADKAPALHRDGLRRIMIVEKDGVRQAHVVRIGK